MQTRKQALYKLEQSKFRSSFHLKEKDIIYIDSKGWEVIEKHAYDFVKKNLAPARIENDGKQTPMKGHPVFIAQHACACCCRGCLNKWYHVQLGVELTDLQIDKIVHLLMDWLKNEYQKQKDVL